MLKYGDKEQVDVLSEDDHSKIAAFSKRIGKRLEDLTDEEREELQALLEDE